MRCAPGRPSPLPLPSALPSSRRDGRRNPTTAVSWANAGCHRSGTPLWPTAFRSTSAPGRWRLSEGMPTAGQWSPRSSKRLRVGQRSNRRPCSSGCLGRGGLPGRRREAGPSRARVSALLVEKVLASWGLRRRFRLVALCSSGRECGPNRRSRGQSIRLGDVHIA